MGYWLQVAAGIGFFLSIYAIYVEYRINKNSNFRAACDISKKVSCSKPIKSAYGHVFGIPNSVIGIIYYPAIIYLSLVALTNHILILSSAALTFSIYLAYALYFKVKSVCPICTSIYAVNVLIPIFAYFGI